MVGEKSFLDEINKKYEILKYEKSFLDEIKSIFPNF